MGLQGCGGATGLWWRSDRRKPLARDKRGQKDNIKTYLGEGKQPATACTGFIWLRTGYKWMVFVNTEINSDDS